VNPLIKYIAVGAVSFVVTYLLTPWVMRWALRFGFVDEPGERRIHTGRIPRAGGLAVLLGFHAGCLVLFFLPWGGFNATIHVEWYRGILLPGLVLLVAGLWDDRWGIPALVKLAAQVLAGFLAWGAGLQFGAMLGWNLPWGLDAVVTVLWCVGFMNAFNLIDGLDGLATGLGTLAALGLAGASVIRGVPGDTLVLLALAGSCLAFLRFNFHPAKVFLGDTGSLFIGFTLAAASLGSNTKGVVLVTLGVPVLVAGIPILDAALAIWRRTLNHRRLAKEVVPERNGVMSADSEHLHHRLLDRLGSQPRVAGVLYAASAVLIGAALLSVVVSRSGLIYYLLVLIAGSYVIIRHLAHVELWRSGQLLASGLRRPPRQVISVLLYPFLDLGLLTLAHSIAFLVMNRGDPSLAGFKAHMLGHGLLWVALPFVAMTLARVYYRIWSRARLLDYAGLALAIVTGAVVAAAFQRVWVEHGGPDSRLAFPLVYAALAVPLCATLRILPRAFLDLSAGNDSTRAASKELAEHVLLYGAGYGCMLYLRARAYSIDLERPPVIMGILDDDTNLKGRYLSGHRILGGLNELPGILEKHQATKIIATTILPPGVLDRLMPLLHRHGISLFQWSVGMEPLFSPPPERESETALRQVTASSAAAAASDNKDSDEEVAGLQRGLQTG
jgi:UDP-N-acetylmuramyl pentapeptide phosphotransferase/UDP-N-acetylglucosamine-1-phosphate transferase